MPQLQLPIFSDGIENLTAEIGFQCREKVVTYFNGHLPIFKHAEDDIRMFRIITSQFMDEGLVTQSRVAKAFGVPLRTVKRYLKIYRKGGAPAIYAPPKKRSGHKLTGERLAKVQEMLYQGVSVPEIGRELGILPTTLHKAIASGRLKPAIKKKTRQRL